MPCAHTSDRAAQERRRQPSQPVTAVVTDSGLTWRVPCCTGLKGSTPVPSCCHLSPSDASLHSSDQAAHDRPHSARSSCQEWLQCQRHPVPGSSHLQEGCSRRKTLHEQV